MTHTLIKHYEIRKTGPTTYRNTWLICSCGNYRALIERNYEETRTLEPIWVPAFYQPGYNRLDDIEHVLEAEGFMKRL